MAAKAETLLIFGAVAGGLYIAYQLVQGLKDAGAEVADTVGNVGKAIYHGAQVITAPVADVLAWWWMLDDPPGAGGLLGNVVFPNGQQSPLSSYKIKTDKNGSVYINSGSSVYQLQPSDSNGNWPAVPVVGS